MESDSSGIYTNLRIQMNYEKHMLYCVFRSVQVYCITNVHIQINYEKHMLYVCVFRSHLGPLRSWMAKVLPVLDDSEPVHGDLDTVNLLTDAHSVRQCLQHLHLPVYILCIIRTYSVIPILMSFEYYHT